MVIIDAWMQHPSAEFLADPMSDLAGLRLDDQATDLFLYGNAERVFGLTPVAGRS